MQLSELLTRVIGKRPIRFPFDERKSAAAASLLLERAGGAMDYLALIKLLYLVDRESLERFGRPITGDRYISMKDGSVLSRIYNFIKLGLQDALPAGAWAGHIENVGRYRLRLRGGKPDLGPLSEREIQVVAEVFERYRRLGTWDLRDETHTLPEWEDPGSSSREIPIEQILQALGKSKAEIEEVRQAAREEAYFHTLFRQ